MILATSMKWETVSFLLFASVPDAGLAGLGCSDYVDGRVSRGSQGAVGLRWRPWLSKGAHDSCVLWVLGSRVTISSTLPTSMAVGSGLPHMGLLL